MNAVSIARKPLANACNTACRGSFSLYVPKPSHGKSMRSPSFCIGSWAQWCSAEGSAAQRGAPSGIFTSHGIASAMVVWGSPGDRGDQGLRFFNSL